MEGKDVLVVALMYGNYPDIHHRLITSLKAALVPGMTVWAWLNQVCQPTFDLLAKHREFALDVSSVNVPKYQVMRTLYDRIQPGQFKWVLWLDDDTHFPRADALEAAMRFIDKHESEHVCYVGEKWFVDYLPGQEEFIKQSPWYHGVPFDLVGKAKKPGIHFMTGGYVWLRVDVMKQLNWPDTRLVHNGGDTLLAEAIRQRNLPSHHYNFGVKVNDAKRRGRSDAPAGCSDPSERR